MDASVYEYTHNPPFLELLLWAGIDLDTRPQGPGMGRYTGLQVDNSQ